MTQDQQNQISVAGLNIDDQSANMLSMGLHGVAGVIPAAPGTGLELLGDVIDEKRVIHDIVATHHKALLTYMINKQIVLPETKSLLTEDGIQLVKENADALPPAIAKKVNDASDYAKKLSKFGAQTAIFLPFASAGLVAGLVLGTAADQATAPIVNDLLEIHESLSPTEVVPAINQLANTHLQQQQKTGMPVKLDKELLGAMLIASYPDQFKNPDGSDMNNQEFVAMFSEHLEARKENPEAVTRLSQLISEQDSRGAFSTFLPDDADLSKLPGNTSLEMIANQVQPTGGIHSVEDIRSLQDQVDRLVFDLDGFKNRVRTASINMNRVEPAATNTMQQQALEAAGPIHRQMAEAGEFQGLPVKIPTGGKSKGPK